MTEKLPSVQDEFEDFLRNEAVHNLDVSLLMKEFEVNTIAKLANCVASKEEFLADIWSAMIAVDATKKPGRRAAVLAAYEKAVVMYEKERFALAEARLIATEKEIAAAEAGKRLDDLNDTVVKSVETNVMSEQNEFFKLMMKDKAKKVR